MHLKSSLTLILSTVFLTLTAHAQLDYFIHFPTDGASGPIHGGTLDNVMKDKKALELINFEFGAENNINIGSISTGGGAGKATFKELTITANIGDTHTPQMLKYLVEGDHMDEAIITARRSSGGPAGGTDLFRISMKLVMFQDISITATDGDQSLLTAVLQFGAIKVETIELKANGTTGATTDMEWSRVLNTANYAVD
ncbi:MAG: type VI secretion system tube protein Hcp [Roseibacillus sp.]